MPQDETTKKEGETAAVEGKSDAVIKPAPMNQDTSTPDTKQPADRDEKTEPASDTPSTEDKTPRDDLKGAEPAGPSEVSAGGSEKKVPDKDEKTAEPNPGDAAVQTEKSDAREEKKESSDGDKKPAVVETEQPSASAETEKKETSTPPAAASEGSTGKSEDKKSDPAAVRVDSVLSEKKVILGDESKSVTQNERQLKLAQKPIKVEESAILVVEDNVVNFRLFARLLGYMGVFDYEWKTSGWQVAEFAATMSHIDLILLDIRLPYEDGFEVIKKLRQDDNLKDTLIVAVTAEASVQQMHRAQEEGFDGFIGKPIDPDRFPGQIKRILSGTPVWEIH